MKNAQVRLENTSTNYQATAQAYFTSRQSNPSLVATSLVKDTEDEPSTGYDNLDPITGQPKGTTEVTSPLTFYLQNHLGNTRLQFRANTPGAYAIDYAADYLPFGKILREYPACNRDRFLSTHHERDTKTGYDNCGARLYDGEIGRFLGVDPLAGEMPEWSTYNYVFGNPVKLVDPDGKHPIIGAGIGLVVGVGVSMWNQRNNESYDFTQIAIDGAKGAITGGLIGAYAPAAVFNAGTTSITLEGIAINGTISGTATGVADLAGQMTEVATGRRTAEEISLVETGKNMAVGDVSGGVGGYVGGRVQIANSAASPRSVSEVRAASSGNGARASQRAAVSNLGPNPTRVQVQQARSTARAQVRDAAYRKVDARAKVYTTVGTVTGASTTNATKQTMNKLIDYARGK